MAAAPRADLPADSEANSPANSGGQLAFDMQHRPAFGREEFLLSACNGEAVAWIDAWPDWPASARGLNVFGPRGSGKSHLGSVWQAKAQAAWIATPPASRAEAADLLVLAESGDKSGEARNLVIDGLTEDWPGEPLLHLYTLVAERGGDLLVLSREPVTRLSLTPPDLASRLATLSVVALGLPDDAVIRGVMAKMFRDRQLRVSAEVLTYLVSRMERSFAAASRLVARLDALSLAERRPVTIAVARKALEAEGAAE